MNSYKKLQKTEKKLEEGKGGSVSAYVSWSRWGEGWLEQFQQGHGLLKMYLFYKARFSRKAGAKNRLFLNKNHNEAAHFSAVYVVL